MTRKSYIVAGLALLLLGIFWIFAHHREREIFPGPRLDSLAYYAYDDRSEGGQSQAALRLVDSTLLFDFRLAAGAPFPYAGSGLALTSEAQALMGEFTDLDGYDSLRIEARSNRTPQARLQILTNDPSLTRADDPLSKRFFVQSIALGRSFQTLRMPLSNFQTPEWWYERHHMQPDYGLKNMDRVTNFEITTGGGVLLGVPDTLEIRSIVFYGDNHFVNQAALVLGVLLVGFLVIRWWLDRAHSNIMRQTQQQVRREESLKGYEKLEVRSHRSQDLQKVLDYLHNNYSNSELSQEQFCHDTGINRNRLAELLKGEVGTSFRTYLNEIRLTEAARIIAETDLQMTEVAYKVGFGNVSHFNRLFKEKYELTPLEYRRQHAK